MERQQKMAKVSVEVQSGAARFRVGVQARSIREALSLVGSRFPQRDVKVVFPIELEGFLAGEPSALAGMAGSERVLAQAA
jgi:hypothetical protein